MNRMSRAQYDEASAEFRGYADTNPDDGDLSPQQITFQLHSEGIREIYLVSENPDAYPAADIAPGPRTAHRDALDAVPQKLREVNGASAIVFVQTCAADKRRRR